jgi:cell division protein FtsB
MSDGRVESGGRLTTTIPRPKDRRASDAGRSRLGDIGRRRRLPRADRIAGRRRLGLLFGLAGLAVALAIGAALFLLPVRTWFDQDRQLDGLENELSELQTVNDDLENEVDLLQTDDGIVGAAREELGHIQPGDNRETMQPLPALPRDLPQGWPYSQAGQIIAIREAAAEAAADGSADGGDGDGDGGWIGPPAPATAAVATTVAPTTVAPTTVAPTSVAPTTVAATTVAPTTLPATSTTPPTSAP